MTQIKTDPALAEVFREGMRRTATGVAVVTTEGPGGKAGVTVSTLCSLSLEPPSVVACIHSQSSALASIVKNGRFAASVLTEGQSELAAIFAGKIADQAQRFAYADWKYSGFKQPELSNAAAFFDCELAAQFEFGSHKLIIGVVRDVRFTDERPLVFWRQEYTRLEG